MVNSEKQLIRKLKKGDEDAFKYFFMSYYSGLCVFSKKYVNTPEVAEEIVQDTYLTLWEKRKLIKVKKTIKPFLFKTVQ